MARADTLTWPSRAAIGPDASPNAASVIAAEIDARGIAPATVWGVLALRSVLLVALQSAGAAAFAVGGAADPWRASADWWLGWLLLANVVNLGLLARLVRGEGIRLGDLYRVGPIDRAARQLGPDLRWAAVALIVSGPLSLLPGVVVSSFLWADPQTGSELSFRAIPVVGAVAIALFFPIVHALGELPTYYGYVLPRLQALYGWNGRAVLVTGVVLSTQHVFLPLLFDWRFAAWRAVMFLPFALWVGFAIYRRPTILPFMVAAHALLDSSLPIFVLIASL